MSKEEEKKQPTHYVISKSTRDTVIGLLAKYEKVFAIMRDLYEATPVNIEKSQPKQKELPLEKAINEKEKKEGK